MRARIVFFGALMLLSGCRTSRTTAKKTPFALSPEEQDLTTALAHFALGSLYEQDLGPNSPESIHEFELASEYDPGRHRIHSKIAVGYLVRRQPSLAVAALEASCRHSPEALQPRIDLAVTCQLAGKLDAALKHFETAITLAPTESALYASAAKLYFHKDDDDAGINVLRRGIRKAPNPALLHMLSTRGRQLIGKKDLDRALRYFVLLWEEGREAVTPELQNLIGQLNLELNRPETAAVAFRTASEGKSPPPETFTKLGSTLMHLNRRDEALVALEHGRELHPQNTRLLLALGMVYNVMDRFEDAIQAFAVIKKLADADPAKKLAEAFYITYGSTCERTGRTLRGEEMFKTCLDLYPDSDQALNYLAYVWADGNQNLEQAMQYVTRALELSPGNAAYTDTLAWIHYRNGNYTEAVVEMEKALALMPDDPILNEHMGDAHDALDQPAKAVLYWTRSLMNDPDNHSAAWKLDASGADLDRILRQARKAQKERERHSD